MRRELIRRAAPLLCALAACSGASAPDIAPAVSPAPVSRAAPPAGPLRLPPIAARAEAVSVETPPESPLRFLSGVAIEAAHPRWGGLSGLLLDDDGERFLAISDRGMLFRGRLARRGGAIREVEALEAWPLRGPDGAALSGEDADAEGLARGADGAIYVSYEGTNRVLRYEEPGGVGRPVDTPREVGTLQKNSGLEALAISPEGALVAIPERSGREDRPFPVFVRGPDGRWSATRLDREPPFLVTDAAFGPDGRLYVLERDFSLFGWFRARLRRAAFEDGRLGPSETLAVLSGVDNAEGLALWRDAEGATRLTLVSDDNFNPLQRTLLLEFALPDDRRAPDEAPDARRPDASQ